ncbi:MAG: hypothetical protein AAB869_04290, partial [Patescibacteria group bacterium]
MKISAAQLKILLVGSNLVSEKQFEDAIKKSEQKGIGLDECLVDEGLISDINLGQLMANFLRLDYVNVSRQKIPNDILQIV